MFWSLHAKQIQINIFFLLFSNSNFMESMLNSSGPYMAHPSHAISRLYSVELLGRSPITWHTHRELFFEILLNQTEIRLYLPSSDWFGTKRLSVSFQINLKMVNTLWFQFNLIIFRKDFSVCTPSYQFAVITAWIIMK